jgi:hypothetical protein
MKKLIAFSLTVLAATALSGCTLLYPNWGTDVSPSDSAAPSASSTPTESPATTESPSASAAPTKKSAEVVITDSGVDTTLGALYAVVEVNNIAENGGTCSLTFTGVGTTKTFSAKAEANVNRTECYPLRISLVGLPKGAGFLTVSYESESSFGQSKSIGVVVP